MKHITLYYRQGASDKVYRASIEPKEGGCIVAFAYGRRGATLTAGAKTQTPVAYEDAKRIYDRLVAEKTAKGYTPGEDGTPYQHTEKADATTGVLCQLLNPAEQDQVEKLIADPAFWMQEKFDGRRLLLQKDGDRIIGINRLGLAVALPKSMIDDASQCDRDFIFDGEAIGDTLHVFDALLIGHEDIRCLPYAERFRRLTDNSAAFEHRYIRRVETAFLPEQKEELFGRLNQRGSEGVVFKHIDAPYTAGRPASGGPQFKYKFVETASFIVGKVNAKRSVSLLLFAGDRIVAAGNVTIPPNHEIPKTGAIVEVRYLYAFRESGAIYQPVYLGVRDDIPAEECTTSQLKYKAEAEEVA